ncbi:MAG: Trk system potassium transporter TrkA [Planctomycetales bacterium]|nr:Trk system potassium transporter TrkA [Planctomycetales bacterium]
MRILIAGAGVVGQNLARQLAAERHDVAILDQDPAVVKRVAEKLDVLAVKGSAGSVADLRRAGLEQTELLVAVTHTDEVNLLACYLAGESGVRRKVARVRNLEYAGPSPPVSLAPLHVDRIINPDEILVEGVLRIVSTPGAIEAADFADGEILLRGFEIPAGAPLAGKKLPELRALGLGSALVVGILRGAEFRVPTGGDDLRVGDLAYLMLSPAALPRLLELAAPGTGPARRVVVAGGTLPAVLIAKRLGDAVEEVVLLEADPERAESAAAELRHGTVLRGDGTDAELLREARVGSADVFVAAGPRDDQNLIAALLAKRQGVGRVIVVCGEPSYLPILDSIGVRAAINPRLMTVGAILREIRRGRVHAVQKFQQFEAEALEVEVVAGSRVAGRTLRELKFPPGSLVGAILRDGVLQIPSGDSLLEPGSVVIVFALPPALELIERLFARRGSRATRALTR